MLNTKVKTASKMHQSFFRIRSREGTRSLRPAKQKSDSYGRNPPGPGRCKQKLALQMGIREKAHGESREREI